MKRSPLTRTFLSRGAFVALPVAALLAACGSSSSTGGTTTTLQLKPRITVTSVKGNVESELVAAVYARALEDAGFRVARKDPIEMDRAAYYAAMQKGDFQLIPEYSGDLLKFVFDQPGAGAAPTTSSPSGPATTQPPVTVPASTTTVAGAATTSTGVTTTTTAKVINNGRSSAEQVVALRAALPTALAVGNPAAAENKNVIACTEATIKVNAKVKFDTYTDLASVAPHLVLGAPASFMADKDEGMTAWTNTYGGTFKSTVTVEAADLAKTIDKGSADCFVMNALDPLVTTKKMTMLIDDKAMVRGNAVVALLAKSIDSADLVTALDRVNIALTSTRLNQMLNEISTNHTDPKVVASAFMDTL
jgi:glycine betaine/choline ABC-type transport system substrate-binding protein